MPFHPKKVLPLLEGKEMEGSVCCIFGTKLVCSEPCNITHVTQGFPDNMSDPTTCCLCLYLFFFFT